MGAALRKMLEKQAKQERPLSIHPTLKPCLGHSNRQVVTTQQEVIGAGGGSVTSHYSEPTRRFLSDFRTARPRTEQVMGQKRRRRLSENEAI